MTCADPTLFLGSSAVPAAAAVPPSAMNNASSARWWRRTYSAIPFNMMTLPRSSYVRLSTIRHEFPAADLGTGRTRERRSSRRYPQSMSQLSPGSELEPDFRGYEPIHPEPGWKSLLRKLWAPLAALVGLLVKFGFIAFKFFGLFISVAAYALIWGWKFGVGFVALILVHELGHF